MLFANIVGVLTAPGVISVVAICFVVSLATRLNPEALPDRSIDFSQK
jgi:hypothetical protein